MTALQSIVAYNQAGRVGSSSIYCAGVAIRMAEVSQARRKVQPAAVIHINLNRICNEVY